MIKPLIIALQEIGIKETPGDDTSPDVAKYYEGIGEKDDSIPWCSAFMNWVMKEAGLPGTGSLAARSWLKWGKEVTEPKMGDVVVYWRGKQDSWQGHVGIYINRVGDNIYTLGGNQKNMVCISPYSAKKLLKFVRYERL